MQFETIFLVADLIACDNTVFGGYVSAVLLVNPVNRLELNICVRQVSGGVQFFLENPPVFSKLPKPFRITVQKKIGHEPFLVYESGFHGFSRLESLQVLFGNG